MAESDASLTVMEDGCQQTRKRAYLKDGSEGSSDSTRSTKSKKKAKAEKGKKPSTLADNHDVGLADAKRQLNLARRVQLQQDLEEKVAAKEQQAYVARAKSGYGASSVLYADYPLAELERMAQEDKEEIVDVASKSSNLKATFQKSLKCRAASMCGIVRELVQRTAPDETRQLQAKVDRLQLEFGQLLMKLADLATARPAQADLRPAVEGPSNLEDAIRKVIMEERAFTRTCFAGIEDRLLPEKRLRPPLAADKWQRELGPSSQREDALLPCTALSNQPWTEVVSKGKGKAKKKARTAATPAVPASTPPGPSQTTGKGKGKGKGKKSATKPATAAPAAKRAPAGARKSLVPPKTAAVVVTLTAEAAEQGETYESVLKRARTNADPTQLGISKVACRRTQTGARIFEFSGTQGGANADLFASKLREVIADVAKVARPVKSAALEVTDLDDSVTKEEVVAAVAAIGGCDVAAVQGRGIRPGRGGMGTIRLECPVTAAKA
ncbi:Gag-like protein, partial [Operophtera brumata]